MKPACDGGSNPPGTTLATLNKKRNVALPCQLRFKLVPNPPGTTLWGCSLVWKGGWLQTSRSWVQILPAPFYRQDLLWSKITSSNADVKFVKFITHLDHLSLLMGENELIDIRKRLAEKMAGEITISDDPGETIKKWRKNFEIAQTDLSKFLNVSPSVISDYESGRRKSPGTLIVNKIINALLTIDLQNGGNKLRIYQSILDRGFDIDVVYDIHEYSIPLKLDDFAKMIRAERIIGNFAKMINGYTIIDSLRAIVELSPNEFFRLYGWSTERVLIFTRVSTGKSPLVAIRVTNFKPGAVVFHGLNVSEVDPIAKKIAEIEQVPLMTTNLPINELIKVLRS